ncbi:hypothetical protein CHARACLAT_019089 [Characodon lateralis]|uniref:Uncharacterized protein n=1 Tax=Characodon lateralis TaxID=208331 RepID=A0ABU7E5U9_9TELE|nr:hypothetical protein [Characodon lateralis]
MENGCKCCPGGTNNMPPVVLFGKTFFLKCSEQINVFYTSLLEVLTNMKCAVTLIGCKTKLNMLKPLSHQLCVLMFAIVPQLLSVLSVCLKPNKPECLEILEIQVSTSLLGQLTE